MKDIKSLEKGLRVYLTSKFYPPIPNWVKDVFVDSYKEYWNGNVDRKGLEKLLEDVYTGGLENYGLWVFLKEYQE